MTNVFKDEKTLGAELVRFHRSHSGQPIEGFFKFILAPHLLAIVNSLKILEKNLPGVEKKIEKKGKTK